jgi:hypothetical protein
MGPIGEELPSENDLADPKPFRTITNALTSAAEKVREQCNRITQIS